MYSGSASAMNAPGAGRAVTDGDCQYPGFGLYVKPMPERHSRILGLAGLLWSCLAISNPAVAEDDGYYGGVPNVYYATGKMFYGVSTKGEAGWYVEMKDAGRRHVFWVFYRHSPSGKCKA